MNRLSTPQENLEALAGVFPAEENWSFQDWILAAQHKCLLTWSEYMDLKLMTSINGSIKTKCLKKAKALKGLGL